MSLSTVRYTCLYTDFPTRLESSRSQRVLWLLEELNLEYELKLYHRDPVTYRADPSLSKIYPIVRYPLLELDYLDGKETKKIAESGHILNYLIKHFDDKGKLKPVSEEDAEEVDYYLHLSEGSLQPLLTYLYYHEISSAKTPALAKPSVDKFLEDLDGSYTIPEIRNVLGLLENRLKKKHEETTSSSQEIYFVGHKLSAADIILEYNMAFAFESQDVIQPIHRSKYIYLSKWLSQVKQRNAYLRSVDKVAKLGNNEYQINLE